ncbi:MAG: hypothetical protein M3169_14675, partial [Candidatus Eremiobacteraeota bacterium]|nr:hypothetical protein [Candidatus Eremiobacteraeota bacterium]
TPTPPQCDLAANGKCYKRIVDQTTQAFYKYVLPDYQCDLNSCSYIDSIRQIVLDPTYAVLAPVPPRSPDSELLFKINAIKSVTKECEPFSAFASISAFNSIPWSGSVIGGPSIAPLGLGEPSIYATVNHFTVGGTTTGSFLDSTDPWSSTNLEDFSIAVAYRLIGSPSTSTYSSENATRNSYVQWYPDFPGCDAAGDPNSLGREFGISGAVLEFEIYQAEP